MRLSLPACMWGASGSNPLPCRSSALALESNSWPLAPLDPQGPGALSSAACCLLPRQVRSSGGAGGGKRHLLLISISHRQGTPIPQVTPRRGQGFLSTCENIKGSKGMSPCGSLWASPAVVSDGPALEEGVGGGGEGSGCLRARGSPSRSPVLASSETMATQGSLLGLPLGAWSLDTLCSLLPVFSDNIQGAGPSLHVSVNISPGPVCQYQLHREGQRSEAKGQQ